MEKGLGLWTEFNILVDFFFFFGHTGLCCISDKFKVISLLHGVEDKKQLLEIHIKPNSQYFI